MSVQAGEGTTEIIYGSRSIPAGAATLGGYLSRPDRAGEWPTIAVFGPEPEPSSSIKDLCRRFARHGIAAVAPEMTVSHEANTRIATAVAAFITNDDSGWSNARFGYGVLAFGPALYDAATLASSDGRATAVAAVEGRIDEAVAEALTIAATNAVFFGSRGDAGADIGASLAFRDILPRMSFVIYPDAEARWWDIDAVSYDEAYATDTFNRLVAFFSDTLPVRL